MLISMFRSYLSPFSLDVSSPVSFFRRMPVNVVMAFILSGILSCCMLGLPSRVFAYSAMPPTNRDFQTVSMMEQNLFSVRYDGDSLDQRLSRLETTVFGETKPTHSPQERIHDLQAVLSSVNVPQSAPSRQSDGNNPSPNNSSQQASKAPSETAMDQDAQPGADYPIVSVMERRVFGKTYEKEDISQRLNRLEQYKFAHTQTGSLSSRVDSLKMVILGDAGTTASADDAMNYNPGNYSTGHYNNAGSNNGYSDDGYSGSGGTSQAPTYSVAHVNPPDSAGSSAAGGPPVTSNPGNGGSPTPDMVSGITQTEKQVLHHTYPNDSFDDRLARLEQKVFHQVSPPTVSDEERLQRVIAVASANGENGQQSALSKVKSSGWQLLIPVAIFVLGILL